MEQLLNNIIEISSIFKIDNLVQLTIPIIIVPKKTLKIQPNPRVLNSENC